MDKRLNKSLFFISFGIFLLGISFSWQIEEGSRIVRTEAEPITQVGFVGLGKMGLGMAEVIGKSGIKIFGTDKKSKAIGEFDELEIGASAKTLREMIEKMGDGRKIIWLMVPEILKEGEISPVDVCIEKIIELKKEGLLHQGDIIIDGGNSNHIMHKERARKLANEGIILLDAGVSGGTEAAAEGRLSIMVGGDYQAYKKAEPIFKALAMKEGYGWVGEAGAGHFVKSVHNAIEYIFFQVLAEGAEILANYHGWSLSELSRIMGDYNQEGSPLFSTWIIELAQEVFEDKDFPYVAPHIFGGSTGSWVQQDGDALGVDTPLLDETLKVRISSREIDLENYELKPGHFAHSFIALLRNKMGGHDWDRLSEPITEVERREILGIGAERLAGIGADSLEKDVLKAISFGWLLALKEGYEVIAKSEYGIDTQGLAKLNKIWKNGSVIRSYLVGLAEKNFSQGKDIERVVEAIFEDTGLDISIVKHIQEIATILGVPTPALNIIIGESE